MKLSQAIACLIVVTGVNAAAAPALAEADSPGGRTPSSNESAIPPRPVLDILVKSTLAAFNHANQTGEYVVLHKLGAPEFQREVPVQRLFEVFKPFRQQNLDIAPILVREVVMIEAPAITDKGWLRLVGRFDTQPRQVFFRLQFRQTEGSWRLVDIHVRVPPAP